MCAMYGLQEKDMKYIQQIIPGATPEQVKVFRDCMESDAVYKGGLFYGVFGVVSSYYMMSSKMGRQRPLISAGIGIVGYALGKFLYAPFCSAKAFGPLIKNADVLQSRDQNATSSGHSDNFDHEDNQSGYGLTSDKLLDAESEWKTLDSHFDSDTNTFDDTINQLQEDETNIERRATGKRVTYDDLWTEHRNAEMQGQRKHQYGPAPMGRARPDSQQRDRIKREDSGIFEAKVEEGYNWEFK